MRVYTPLLALLAAACSGGPATPPEVAPAPAPAPVVAPAPANANDTTLVPSPTETQRALEAAGIDTQLASLIHHADLNMSGDDADRVAVRTGVILADMLLTVRLSTKEQLLGQVDGIKAGMQQLEGGSDIGATLADIRERVEGDSVTRDALLEEFEMLSGAIIPELEFNGRERIVPLIQAGSWLEASNLLATALSDAGKPDAGDGLLKQPEVVAYFAKYVSEHGSDEAPAVTGELIEALAQLDTVAQKTESLTNEDLNAVKTSTGAVLALL